MSSFPRLYQKVSPISNYLSKKIPQKRISIAWKALISETFEQRIPSAHCRLYSLWLQAVDFDGKLG